MKRFICIIWVLLIVSAGSSRADGPGDCTNISTDKGKVTGTLDGKTGVCEYKGIPYAAPPVGELRFTMPREHAAWTTTLSADAPGNECMQFPLGMVANVPPTGNEDCLFLNVFQPSSSSAGPRPVMVFIHGGGFVMGSGTQSWYDSAALAAFGDLIVVTINYRLGPFGFMVHPSLKDGDGREGNYGFYDQVAALKWVKKNIGNFGGDAGNVTIFGESAGGMSVGLHLVSPLSKGLYKRAIIESGPITLIRTTAKEAEEKGLAQAAALGCDKPDGAAQCLRALSAEQIMNVLKPVMGHFSDDANASTNDYRPFIDGYAVPADPMALMKSGGVDKSIPVLLGSNKNEAAIFTFQKKIGTQEGMKEAVKTDAAAFLKVFGIEQFPEELYSYYTPEKCGSPKQCYNDILTDTIFGCPTRGMAGALAASGNDARVYYFTKTYSDKGLTRGWGAFHGSELFFLFGTLNVMGSGDTDENKKVSKLMMGLWTSFARDGVATSPGAPEWPRYDDATAPFFQIDVAPKILKDVKGDTCRFVDKMTGGN